MDLKLKRKMFNFFKKKKKKYPHLPSSPYTAALRSPEVQKMINKCHVQMNPRLYHSDNSVENEATIICVTSKNNYQNDCYPDCNTTCGPDQWCWPNDNCDPACDMGSDIFYKRDISGIKKGETLNKLMQLNPVTYRYKQCYFDYKNSLNRQNALDSDMTKDIRFGLIAQELQNVYPELVHTNQEGYLSVNYIDLVSILIDAVKTLNEEVVELKRNFNDKK